VYDDGRLLEELDKSGATNVVRARYYYADEDAPFAADLADASGNLQRYFYVRDAQKSVIALVDTNGIVIERVAYDPWGQPQIQLRDTAPPQIAAILPTVNNELLLEFTEPIMPPVLHPAGAGDIATQTQPFNSGPSGDFQLFGTNGQVVLGAITYEEDLPIGFPFGAILRLRPQGTVPTNLLLVLKSGAVVDEWGQSNVEEQISFNLSFTLSTNSVFSTNSASYIGPLPVGATAPRDRARSAVGNAFLFQGQYFDYDTGLLNLRARWYDPYTGQFLEHDPIAYANSVNPYAGLGNNPATLRDPSGLAPKNYAGKESAGASYSRRTPTFVPKAAQPKQVRRGIAGGSLAAKGSGVRHHMTDADTEIDQPAVDDLTTRQNTISDEGPDTITMPPQGPNGPHGGGGSGSGSPPPYDRVWRGVQPRIGQGIADLNDQLAAGAYLSPAELSRSRGQAIRPAAELRAEAVAHGRSLPNGIGDFSAGEVALMDDLEVAALVHIAGSGPEATGISTGLNPFEDEGPVRYAGLGPSPIRRGDWADRVPILVEFEVDQGAGVGPFNFEEGNEVTFFDAIHFRRAWVYHVAQTGPGTYHLTQVGFFQGHH